MDKILGEGNKWANSSINGCASSSLPFLMLAYILRGIDVANTILTVSHIAVLSVLATHLCVFAGALRFNIALRFVILPVSLLLFLTFSVSFMIVGFVHNDDTTWWHHVVYIANTAVLCLIMRSLTAANLAPARAKRIHPLASIAIIFWAYWGMIALTSSLITLDPSAFFVWAILVLVFVVTVAYVSAIAKSIRRRK